MDNRWRFLYYDSSELWGRMRKGLAGREKTGGSGAGGVKENPHAGAETVIRTETK